MLFKSNCSSDWTTPIIVTMIFTKRGFLKLYYTTYFLDILPENDNYNSSWATGSHNVRHGKWFHGTTKVIAWNL